jgi:hypothetical protein
MGRRLFLGLVLLSALAIVMATGSFSAATMPRSVAIPVADDPEDGLVGIDADEEITLEYGSHRANNSRGPVMLITVMNNFERSIDIEVDVSGDRNTPPNLQGTPRIEDETLDPGESADVMADIVCASQPPETWTVTISVSSDGVSSVVTHEVTIVCEHTPGSNNSSGSGNSGR